MNLSFEVETEAYSGPIGLLLSLITAQKVDLWEVSISGLVDEYLRELEKIREMDLEIATEFLVVASTLIELKCRRLFPSDREEIEDDFAFFEERDLLLARLLEVTAYRQASTAIIGLMGSSANIIPHVGVLEEPYASKLPDILVGISPDLLAESLKPLLILEEGRSVDVTHLPQHPISISAAAKGVLLRLMEARRCNFAQLVNSATSKFEVVVGFLAVLELYRQSRILLKQERSLGDILIEWNTEELSDEEIEEFLELSGFQFGSE